MDVSEQWKTHVDFKLASILLYLGVSPGCSAVALALLKYSWITLLPMLVNTLFWPGFFPRHMGFLTCHSLSYSDLGKESSKGQMYPRLILLQALHLWVKRQHLDAASVNDQYFPINP